MINQTYDIWFKQKILHRSFRFLNNTTVRRRMIVIIMYSKTREETIDDPTDNGLIGIMIRLSVTIIDERR